MKTINLLYLTCSVKSPIKVCPDSIATTNPDGTDIHHVSTTKTISTDQNGFEQSKNEFNKSKRLQPIKNRFRPLEINSTNQK